MEANRTDESKFAAAPETKLHFLDYWRIIRIRKTVILAVFLLVALTTTVVTYLLPPAYSSRALISIEQDVPDASAREQAVYWHPSIDPFFIQTEFERIQSKPVLYEVIEVLNLREEWGRKYKQPTALTKEKTYELLKNSIDVKQQHNTTLVEIHAYSDDKDEAARLANKVAEVYADVRNKARLEIAKGGLKSLRDELFRIDLDISNKQVVVNRLRQEFGIADYEAAFNMPTPSLDQETLRRISDALLEARDRFIQASNRWIALVSLTNREQLKAAAPLQVPGVPQLGDLITMENSTAQKVAALAGRGLEREHPDILAAANLLTTISNQLDGALSGVLIALKAEMQSQLGRLQQYTDLQTRAMEKDRTNYSITRPYYVAKEELTQRKLFRERVSQNLELQAIEANAPTKGAVQVIEQAEKVDKPYRPNKKLNIGLGIAVGLLIGVGLAFFIEYLDTSVKTIDDVERALQAPVLGVIPQNVGLLIEEGPESPHAEAYRVLRTNVLFSRKDPKLNSLTVVSGGAGEGKSTTIFNLATVFAQNGQRVLIIDSDLRRPSLHKYLHISNSMGLTNFLLKQNTLEEVIQTTAQQNLDFLPSGRLPSSSMGILSSPQMKELIRDLKRRYDFVFFDSPPIMGVSDASVLASEVDMVLQVIQYRRYPQPMTIRAKQMIEKVGGNLLGIVLNNINVSQDENYYYYSGYYYDYYTKGEYGEYTSREKKGRGEYTSRESRPEKTAAGANGEQAKVEIKSKF
jgi:capsular exopolysaccharide synthesis family protein